MAGHRDWPRIREWEVPNPLTIEICYGQTSIEIVLQDVLALTNLNYNACRYGDGKPITLKFAEAVGEVLMAGPVAQEAPCLLCTTSK